MPPGAQRGSLSFDQEGRLSLCTAGGPTDMPKERKDPKSCSRDTRGLAKEARGEVGTSREKNPDEEEAGRENSSAEVG